MTDPVTPGTGLTAGAVSVGALGWWAGLDPGVAIGAFWGAIFFVLSSKELTLIAKTGFGGVSFFFGIICANWAAELITWGVHKFASGASDAPTAMGAFIAAAVAIQTLMAITTKDFTKALLDRFLAWLKSALELHGLWPTITGAGIARGSETAQYTPSTTSAVHPVRSLSGIFQFGFVGRPVEVISEQGVRPVYYAPLS